MLRAEYRPEGEDSHPNEAANRAVGPVFVEAVVEAVSGGGHALRYASCAPSCR